MLRVTYGNHVLYLADTYHTVACNVRYIISSSMQYVCQTLRATVHKIQAEVMNCLVHVYCS